MKIAVANADRESLASIRKMLRVHDANVIWTSSSGEETLQKIELEPADLLLVDINVLEGKDRDLIQRMMKKASYTIMLTTKNIGANAAKIYEAMGHGATDVVHIPSEKNERHEILVFLKKIQQYAYLLGKADGKDKYFKKKEFEIYLEECPNLVVIGSSTGGPIALAKILGSLPKNLKVAIVVIQHVDEEFAQGMAEWLQGQTHLKVKIAKNNDIIEEGIVYLAGTEDHLVINENLKLSYSRYPLAAICRPSVDVFFQSVAEYWPEKSIAILLTGMGRDGAKGLKILANLGWHTVVQDEKSSVVFGMPKAAIEIQAAKMVLPLNLIANEIFAFIKSKLAMNPWKK